MNRSFQTSPGFHGDTNAVKQLLHHYASEETAALLTEEMLLGIGGGIGYGYFTFFYEKEDFINFHLGTRASWESSGQFMTDILGSLGCTVSAKQTKNKRTAFDQLADHTERGIPAIIAIHQGIFDSGGIEQKRYPFYCVAYSINQENGTAKLAYRYKDPVEVTVEQLIEGRSNLATAKLVNHALWLTEEKPLAVTPESLVAAARQGIRRCLSHAHNPRMSNFGVTALEKWESRLSSKGKDSWIQLFAKPKHWIGALYSTFTHITVNTDGSAFRGTYARFLEMTGNQIDEPLLLESGRLFQESAALWKQLSETALPDENFADLKALVLERERRILEGTLSHTGLPPYWDQIRALKAGLIENTEWPFERLTEHYSEMRAIVLAILKKEREALELLERSLHSSRWEA
ncbi:DUF4872 domain-containing protein [Paenibacillus beijingensis]|uniref:Butirosin biosynthesis protein H N-terminal domain-containing protein n=1 Tax=Paenibacillus beijingensis TaxID=1126833 RepID=A0A0D5NHS6_9BACL|nr:DUF4872 domain-containing protein [Paenibacillus beijingensis]AJY74821.1 hypothetical protein VN24_09770 [Paenibacillus beijingensis]